MSPYVWIYTKSLTFWLRYPIYKNKWIEKIILKYSPSNEEISQLRSYSASNRVLLTWHILLILYALSFFFFTCSLTMILLLYNDYINPENNIGYNSDETGSINLWCLHTNCTNFSADVDVNSSLSQRANLARDFLKLPFFSLCYPNIRSIALPLVDLDTDGYLLMLYTSLGMFSFCVNCQVAQVLNPTGDESMLFAVMPDLTLKIVHDKLRKIYVGMLVSSYIYKRNYIKDKLIRTSHGQPKTAISGDDAAMITNSKFNYLSQLDIIKHQSLCAKSNYQADFDHLMKAHYHCGDTKYVDLFVMDCVPLIRTKWWHERLNYTYKINILIGSPISTCMVFLCMYFVKLQIDVKNQVYSEIGRSMEKNNCKIWTRNRADDGTIGIDLVDLANYKISYNSGNIIQHIFNSVVNLTLIMGPCMLSSYICQTELLSLIHEIQSQLAVILELVNIQLWPDDRIDHVLMNSRCIGDHCPREAIKIVGIDKNLSISKLNFQRELLRLENTNLKLIHSIGTVLSSGNYSKAKRLAPSIFNRDLAIEMLAGDKNDKTILIDLLGKLYVKVKFYLNSRDHYGQSFTLLILYATLSCYIESFLFLAILRKSKDKYVLNILMVLSTYFFASSLLLIIRLNYHVSLKSVLRREDLIVQKLSKLTPIGTCRIKSWL